MRRDEHAAANQQQSEALQEARRRAVAECQADLRPRAPFLDRVSGSRRELTVRDAWDRLRVDYLKADWPPSMLN
jgi:hypothetical protein